MGRCCRMLRGPGGSWQERGRGGERWHPRASRCALFAQQTPRVPPLRLGAPSGVCTAGTLPRCRPSSVARPRSSCGAGTHPALQGAPGMWPGPIPKPPSSQRAAPRRCQVDGGSLQIPWSVPEGGCWKCRALPAGSRAGAPAPAPRGSEQSARALTPRSSAAGRRRGGAGRKRSVTPGSPGSCP